jgi:hypothetical protein
MQNLGLFYGHSVNFKTIQFTYFICGHFVYFSQFGTLLQEQSGSPVANDAEKMSM